MDNKTYVILVLLLTSMASAYNASDDVLINESAGMIIDELYESFNSSEDANILSGFVAVIAIVFVCLLLISAPFVIIRVLGGGI